MWGSKRRAVLDEIRRLDIRMHTLAREHLEAEVLLLDDLKRHINAAIGVQDAPAAPATPPTEEAPR